MDRFSKLVAGLLFSFSASSYAGYAQLAPPVGWSPGAGLSSGAGGAFNFGNAANSAQLVNGTVRTSAALNVGGRAVSVPATMRFAANAPKIISAVLYLNPALRTIGTIAGWLGAAALIYDVTDGLWKKNDPDFPVSDGFEYGRDYQGVLIREPNPDLACKKLGPLFFNNVVGSGNGWQLQSTSAQGQTCVISIYNPSQNRWDGYRIDVFQYPGKCPAGSYSTPAGCVMQPPPRTIDQEEFERALDGQPMPEKLPEVFPQPLPIDVPEIQPMFVPTGNPVQNPNYDPSKPLSPDNQPWNQPGVRVVPSPSPGNPWQVDLQPVDRPVATPTPSPDPKPDPDGNPDDKPKDKDPGLCDLYPEILACAKLDEPPSIDLQNIDKPISITPDSGWGSDDAICPAPRVLNVQGQQIAIPFDLFCTYMQGMRPIIIAMAWLSAAFILIGARESS
ncbi:virulence factor TspB C-terminal domain-related protein [Delftia sp. PE138]|uniref:virulence factor TspB C-terminal domain-related protein n=1 Tax=Delftia sp. PE138 TaxID=1812483 RepID=UPI001BAEB7B0|nr:virulence factor TspB C-terminal domain-related protein [Delftia sp. PE138]MBS3720943.1 hypothetical protein [Delftia sp. PE138]